MAGLYAKSAAGWSIMATVKLNPWQMEVANDPHRFRVICAGRRSGKSVLSRLLILKWAVEENGLYWIVSPTYKASKMIHWRELNKEIPRGWVTKKNEVELSITLKNGSIIELKGSENPDALRGIKLRGLVVDEIASIRNWNWLWQEVLRPTLTDYAAPAIFISTPKGFNHFHELYQLGQEDGEYKSWRFSSYDNPFIPKTEIDQAKKELTEDAFYQEYMADFRKFTGSVFKPWDRQVHVIKPFEVPSEWQKSRGFDYGATHFTASPKFATNRDRVHFLTTCYMDSGRHIEEHAKVVLAQDFNDGVVPRWGDPSGAQWFLEFNKYGLSIQPAVKEMGQNSKGWVEYGVEKVNELLKPAEGHTIKLPDGREIENAPRLFVFDTPENQPFIKQIENLKWREIIKGSDNIISVLDESDDPTGGHYDLMAALRYWAVSFIPVDKQSATMIAERNKQEIKKWSLE